MSASDRWFELEPHYYTLKFGMRLLLAVVEPADDLTEDRVAAVSWLADKMDTAQRVLHDAFDADLAERRDAQKARGGGS